MLVVHQIRSRKANFFQKFRLPPSNYLSHSLHLASLNFLGPFLFSLFLDISEASFWRETFSGKPGESWNYFELGECWDKIFIRIFGKRFRIFYVFVRPVWLIVSGNGLRDLLGVKVSLLKGTWFHAGSNGRLRCVNKGVIFFKTSKLPESIYLQLKSVFGWEVICKWTSEKKARASLSCGKWIVK